MNIHMAEYHNKFEQLDGNISMDSTEVIEKKPPPKLRHPTHGIGIFRRINSTSGQRIYDFPDGTSLMRDSVES